MRRIFFLLTFLFCESVVFAQRSEVGALIGGSYYIGDLNPSKHFLMTRPAAGILYRYNFNPRFAFKGNFYYGTVAGDDGIANFNKERGLSFKSHVSDFTAGIEFNFLPFVPGNSKFPWTPYVFAGVSLFKFNPLGKYKGKWIELQPMHTEGQGTTIYPDRKPYSLTSFAIPFGLGVKYNFWRTYSIGFEYGIRKTFTDYLDDVSSTYADPRVLNSQNGPVSAYFGDPSKDPTDIGNIDMQRGNSQNKDWYSFFGITISSKIKFKGETCPVYEKGRRGSSGLYQ